MRIIVVTGLVFPPQLTLWSAAADAGVDIHIAGAVTSPWKDGFAWTPRTHHDLPTHVLEPLGPSWLLRRGYQWWWYRDLRGTIERVDPDLIHVIGEVWSVPVQQALLSGRKVVAHSWDNLYRHGQPLEDAIRIWLAERNLAKIAGFASANRRGLELALEHGLDSSKPATVLPPVLPPPTSFNARTRKDSSPPRVGYVGRLVPEKGVDWLIAATSTVSDTPLHVFGTGPDEPRLRAMARALSADVRFHGARTLDEMPSVYASLDIVIVPSRSTRSWKEQFGRVAVEAMSSGAAVIASDSGALPETVGRGGITVPEGDHEALGNAIRSLVFDPGFLDAMQERALLRAQDLHPTRLVPLLISLWDESAPSTETL